MVQLTSTVESCYISNEFQWQVSVNDGNWTNIPGANTASYTVPLQAPGKYKYRLLVSQAGNIQVTNCRVNSNITTIVVVPPPNIQAIGAVICSGQTYTLPSGRLVSAAGYYVDTARYPFGCDSLITNLDLTVQAPVFANSNVAICQGETYTLPSGTIAAVTGIYNDTVKYSSGCDSLISVINLLVKPVATTGNWINICSGQSTTLPWGAIVSASGIYRDTLQYVSGCDSVIRVVQVHVTTPIFRNVEEAVCPGETYTLPSGMVASVPGIYYDTLRTSIGCDSIITLLTLSPAPPPVIQVFKSNDVTCSLGISRLRAAGGTKYLWSPAETLDNPAIFNPVASPASSTVYKVTVTTDEGCVGEDSILVSVSSDPKNPILIPDAFTPNGDGLNDVFGVKFMGQVSDLKFSIYNRWGNRVFYTNDPSKPWDGRSSGVDVKSDVFVYQISATTWCGKIFRTGTVALIR
jgi:gliding motility-associated-like protein